MSKPNREPQVGDLNGDGYEDLWLNYTDISWDSVMLSTKNNFNTANSIANGEFTYLGQWCLTGQRLIIYVIGSGCGYLLCFNFSSLSMKVTINNSCAASFTLNSSFYTASFCDPNGKLYKGDFNGDGKEDLLCIAGAVHYLIIRF